MRNGLILIKNRCKIYPRLANMGRHPPEVPSSSLLHAHTLDWDMDRRVSHKIFGDRDFENSKFRNFGEKIHETR